MYVEGAYGYPHMVGHRADLAGALYNGCKQQTSITFHFSTSVASVNSWSPKPQITLLPRDGDPFTLTPDILLAADGIKSVTRTSMLHELNATASVVDTGQSAYRIMLTRAELQHDPELLSLIDSEAVTRWIGHKRHIIAYPISNKQIYNMATAQPDTNFAAAPSSSYTTKGSKKDMLACYHDFCPRVQKLLNLVPEGEVCEWKLRVHAPLPTWIYGSVALLGDACHPTLPHLAQGAAQAIEDAAVLGVVLGNLPSTSPSDIHKALKVYEDIRKVRAETLVELAAESGRSLHLGEGKAKEERDIAFKKMREEGKGGVPDKWADAEVQRNIYGFDCQKEAAILVKKVFENVHVDAVDKGSVKVGSVEVAAVSIGAVN